MLTSKFFKGAFLLSLLCLFVRPALAQAPSVEITVSIMPPYSPYYSDYSGVNAGKVLLLVRNLTGTSRTVKLSGQLTGDNGIKLSTKSNYVPLKPIILNPNQVLQLSGTSLTEIFDLNTLNVYGVDKAKLVQTSRLPEGNYTFCVQAQDYNTGVLLSSAAPLGCTVLSITYQDAPVLISPVPNASLTATTPQTVTFSWINAGYVPAGIYYNLQVAELPDAGGDPNQVLNATSFPLLNKTLTVFSYALTPSDPPLKVGKRYAWRVKAYDLTGKTVFKNNGVSAAGIFTYKLLDQSEALAAVPVITAPKQDEVFTKGTNGVQPKVSFAWNGFSKAQGVAYQLKISKVMEGVDPQLGLDNNMQVVLDYTLTTNSFALEAPTELEKLARSQGKKGYNAKAELEAGALYAVQVIGTGTTANGAPIRYENFGKSKVVTFRYAAAPLPPEPPKPVENANLTTVKGRFLYRYKAVGEQPVNTAFAFPPELISKKIGNFIQLVQNPAPYPDVICNRMFPADGETLPLKNAKIKIVYTFITSNTKHPTQYDQLVTYDKENAPFTSIGGVNPPKSDIVLGTGTTDENGNFSITYLNDHKIGKLVAYETNDYYKIEYGAVRIAIDEEKYGSSDMILFPQKGKTVSLPDEVVLLTSFNLEVTVKTDKKIADQALTAGNVVPGYPVQLSVLKETYPTNITYPKEARIAAYTGLKANIAGEEGIVLDLGKTNAEGKYTFTRLLSGANITLDKKFIQALEQEFEGNFAYNTQTVEYKPDVCSYCPKHTVNYYLSRRNSAIKVTLLKREIVIQPKNPEIYLRAMNNQNGVSQPVAYATVTIREGSWLNVRESYYKTDENGYLQLKNLPLTTQKEGSVTKITGPKRSIKLSKFGFVDKEVANNQQLAFGERFPAQVEQFMTGTGKIIGQVVNEAGQPVVANVRVGHGPYIKTASNGWYAIENTPSGLASIEIVPVADNYFPETMLKVILQNEYTIISNVPGNLSTSTVVKEKLHRVVFKFVDENGKPVPQSCTSVGSNLNKCYAANPTTGATNELSFASPSDEFHIRTVAAGFVTYDNYVKIPVKKTATHITITLVKGQTITGVVRDAMTGKPVANARVYSKIGTNEDGEVQAETRTDANGKYTLTGVTAPKFWFAPGQYYSPLPVKVYAAKSGDPLYLQDSKSVDGYNGVGSADFLLKPLSLKGNIWDIPVEIYNYKQVGNKYIFSGAFVSLPANANFKPALANARLPFNDLETTIAIGTKGVNIIQPVQNAIPVEAAELKVIGFDQFDFEVMGSNKENEFPKLAITNVNGCGQLNGFVTSELSAFNFSYTYSGRFLIKKDGVRVPGKPEPPLPVFASNCFKPVDTYKLTTLYGKNKFSIHNFSGVLLDGQFTKEGFQINASVDLAIPLVSTATVPAGSFLVKRNEIVWSQYTGNISLGLEKWNVKGTGLQYDLNQGGFRVINGALLTDLPQVPLKDLIIYPNRIDLGLNSFTGNESLSLGGVTPLRLTSGAKITLTYDAAAPFDQKPHYRINISSSQKTVAHIAGIPGLASADRININMLSAYSDGIHKTVAIDPEKHGFFNIISQTVSGIEVGADYFTLVGNTDLGIPGANNNITGRFRYYKSPSDPERDVNNVVCKVEKLQTDMELPGKVKFNGSSFILKQNLFKATGDVLMYKHTIADAVKVTGTVTKDPAGTRMDILPQQEVKMGSRALAIQTGGATVSSGGDGTWSLVKFTARPKGFDSGKNKLFADNQDLIDFVVSGAISSDKESKRVIKLNDINTPFGDLDITFDFDNRSLAGTLTLSSAKITLGPVVVQDGTVNLQIDANGFVMAAAITRAEVSAIPLLAEVKSGIALGYYDGPLPAYMTQRLLGVTLYNQLPGLEQGLKGFYVNVMKSLSKADLPKLPGPELPDIPLVGAFKPTFDFSAGIDLRTSLNVASGGGIMIGGQAFAQASCLYDLELCTIGFSGGAIGSFDMKYGSNGLTGSLLFGVNGAVHYCLGSKSIGISLLLEKESSGFKFKPSLN